MGDSTSFGSEPWMVVPSPNAWPTGPSNSKKVWSSNWNTQQQKGSSAKAAVAEQPSASANSPSFPSSDGLDEILAPKVDGLTFVDNLSPNAWIAKPTKNPSKAKETEDKVNIEDELSKQSLYKTEMCRSFMETGSCRYGNKCQFAHGAHELRPVMRHPKYKTEVCKKFANTGNCPYGNRCRFIHPGVGNSDNDDLQDPIWTNSWSTPTGVATLSSPPNTPEKKSQQDASNEAKRLAIFERIANA
jgi:butyrate response factor 1